MRYGAVRCAGGINSIEILYKKIFDKTKCFLFTASYDDDETDSSSLFSITFGGTGEASDYFIWPSMFTSKFYEDCFFF